MGRKPFAVVLRSAHRARVPGRPRAARRLDRRHKPDVSSPLSLTISVTGCASYDPIVPLCTGPPPLALSFRRWARRS